MKKINSEHHGRTPKTFHGKILLGAKVPIKIWANEVESSAMEQIKNLANFPFAFDHIAIMPDVHMGFGMPIGGVLATTKVVIPNAVGVDIGCGIAAVKIPLKISDLSNESLKKIMGEVRQRIPVGFKKHKIPKKELKLNGNFKIINQELNSAKYQLGTLGGGNHFIEFQKDEKKNIWIMVHSGSRNLGFKVANYYNDLAKSLVKKNDVKIPESWDLNFLYLDSKEGKDYLNEMEYCVNFAKQNRKVMMKIIVEIFIDILKKEGIHLLKKDFGKSIDVSHNYARVENHFGKNVVVHRKGATSAKKGELGIIPGSQGSASYIVKGKGNKESFMSCSHGAGRKMSRKMAREKLDLEEEKMKLEKLGVVHGVRNIKNLDEAAGAYKDIEEVMNNQKDLIEIVERLIPIAVIKG